MKGDTSDEVVINDVDFPGQSVYLYTLGSSRPYPHLRRQFLLYLVVTGSTDFYGKSLTISTRSEKAQRRR